MPSVVNCYMAQLRDVNYQKNRTLFRGNLERIGHAMAYELSRTLSYSLKEVQTPLGVKPVPTYDDHIVVGTVLRAGLAFHQGFLDVFDQADAGFVAAYREEGKREDIRIHLVYYVLQILLGLVASLIAMWYSRHREFAADAGSARLLGTPSSMIAALRRLGNLQPGVLPDSVKAFGINGQHASIFSTHPSLEDRIAALERLQRGI